MRDIPRDKKTKVMKFTTGTKEINETTFTLKRVKDQDLEMNYNIEIGKTIAFDKATGKPVKLYHNVPGGLVKIGENIYNRDGEYYGYRSE